MYKNNFTVKLLYCFLNKFMFLECNCNLNGLINTRRHNDSPVKGECSEVKSINVADVHKLSIQVKASTCLKIYSTTNTVRPQIVYLNRSTIYALRNRLLWASMQISN